MSNVIASLEKVLLPFAVKIGKQPHVNAIKNGFIRLMPLTLAGAMFVLINNVFLSFGEGSFFYSLGIRLDASTIETLNGLKGIGGNVYNGTLGIMSLMAPFFIGILLIGRDIFQRPRRHNAVVQCGQRQRAMNTEEPEQWNKNHIGPAYHATQRCQWG